MLPFQRSNLVPAAAADWRDPAAPLPRDLRLGDGGPRWIARRILRSRLSQFALIGGAIFALAPRPPSPADIEIRGERMAALHAAEAARAGAGRSPARFDERIGEVDQRALEDEILYREGVRLGLDQNDGIVRQRLVQKVLFLAEEMAGAARPASDAELQAFFQANRARFMRPARYRLEQVFQHRREPLAAWLARPSGDAPPGEPSPVSATLDGDRDRLVEGLGDEFARALDAAPIGEWTGPIASAYGFHLVRVSQRSAARAAQFEEVRGAVVEAYSLHRRQQATTDFLASAFLRYRVRVDGVPVRAFTPSGRLAFRGVASGED